MAAGNVSTQEVWAFSGKSKDSFCFRDHQGSSLGTSCLFFNAKHYWSNQYLSVCLYIPQFPWHSDWRVTTSWKTWATLRKKPICPPPPIFTSWKSCEGHHMTEKLGHPKKETCVTPLIFTVMEKLWGLLHHGKVGLPWEGNLCDLWERYLCDHQDRNLCDQWERNLYDPWKSSTVLRKKPVWPLRKKPVWPPQKETCVTPDKETCVTLGKVEPPWERNLCDPWDWNLYDSWKSFDPWDRNLCDPWERNLCDALRKKPV